MLDYNSHEDKDEPKNFLGKILNGLRFFISKFFFGSFKGRISGEPFSLIKDL